MARNTSRPQSAIGGTSMASAMELDPAARFLVEHIGDEEKDKFAERNKKMREHQKEIERQAGQNFALLQQKGLGRKNRKDPNHEPNILEFAAEMIGSRAKKLREELREVRKQAKQRDRLQKALRLEKEDPVHHEWATMMAKNSGLDMQRRGIDTLEMYKEWKARKARQLSASSDRPDSGLQRSRPATAQGDQGKRPAGQEAHSHHKEKIVSMRGHSAPSRRPQLKYVEGRPEAQFELIPSGEQQSQDPIAMPLVLGGSFSIGRGHACDLQITKRVCAAAGLHSISREHCKICQDERGNLTLVDNSSNGTFVNGRMCKGGSQSSTTPLVPGDSIMFGNEVGGCTFTLDLSQQRPRLTRVDITKKVKPPLQVYQPTVREELPEQDPRSRILAGNTAVAIANVSRAQELWGSSGGFLTMASTRRLVALALSGCPEQCLHATIALRSLVAYHTGLNYVIGAGGVSALSSLVARGDELCRAEAVEALHTTILGSAEGRSRVRTDGGLVAMSRLANDPSHALCESCRDALQDMEHLCTQLPPPPSRLIHSRPATASTTGSTLLYGSVLSSRPVTATSNGTSTASTQFLFGGSRDGGSLAESDLPRDDFRPRSAGEPRTRPLSAHASAGKGPRPTSADTPTKPAGPVRFPEGSRVSRARKLPDGRVVQGSLEEFENGDSSDSTAIGGGTDGSDTEVPKSGRWWEDPSGAGYGGLEKEWIDDDEDGAEMPFSPTGLPSSSSVGIESSSTRRSTSPSSLIPPQEAHGPLLRTGSEGQGLGTSGRASSPALRASSWSRAASAGSLRMLRPNSALMTIMENSQQAETSLNSPIEAMHHDPVQFGDLNGGEQLSIGAVVGWQDDEGGEVLDDADFHEDDPLQLPRHRRPRTTSPDGIRRRALQSARAKGADPSGRVSMHGRPPRPSSAVPKGMSDAHASTPKPSETPESWGHGEDWGSPIVGGGSSVQSTPAAELDPAAGGAGNSPQGRGPDVLKRRLSVESTDEDFKHKMRGVRGEIGALWDSFRLKDAAEKQARRREHQEIIATELGTAASESDGSWSPYETAAEAARVAAHDRDAYRPASAKQEMGGWALDRGWERRGEGEKPPVRVRPRSAARSLSHELSVGALLAEHAGRSLEPPAQAASEPRAEGSRGSARGPWSGRVQSAGAMLQAQGQWTRGARVERRPGQCAGHVSGHVSDGHSTVAHIPAGRADNAEDDAVRLGGGGGGRLDGEMSQIKLLTRRLGAEEREELAWSLLSDVVGADGTRAFTARRIAQRQSRPSSSGLAGIPVRHPPPRG